MDSDSCSLSSSSLHSDSLSVVSEEEEDGEGLESDGSAFSEDDSGDDTYGDMKPPKTKHRNGRDRKIWTLISAQKMSRDVYIARVQENNEFWRKKFSKPQDHYVVYRCFDRKCKAELKIYERQEEVKDQGIHLHSPIYDDDKYVSSTSIEVYSSGMHIEHSREEIDAQKKKSRAYG